MTVLGKPSLTAKKTPLIDDSGCGEEVIEIQSTGGPSRRRPSLGAVLCMLITMFLLVFMGIITALQIYEQVTNDSSHNHYQGFCSIPLSREMGMLEERHVPIHWSTENVGRMDPELQVVSFMDEEQGQLMNLLREVLDIDVDDSVEKISVFNNGHPVSFVHDFDANVSGIIDDERCFLMELDPEIVLQPEVFVLGLERGDSFDVSRVRTHLKAILPAVTSMANKAKALSAKCVNKPTYRLQKETEVIIRKRSVDAPPHDFMHFAGKRVQEIMISNLGDLLTHEQDVQQPA